MIERMHASRKLLRNNRHNDVPSPLYRVLKVRSVAWHCELYITLALVQKMPQRTSRYDFRAGRTSFLYRRAYGLDGPITLQALRE